MAIRDAGLGADPPMMLADVLRAPDRLLVLGASGWLGATLISLVDDSIPVLATASHARRRYVEWDLPTVRDFAPTWVANFAFLTPDRLAVEGVEEFTRANMTLTQQFLTSLDLPSVRYGLTMSSGAAVTAPDELYGRLKRAEESEALARADSRRSVMIGRAYSLSGPFVTRPQNYAFSDMVLQAIAGQVTVRAAQPTFRRYVSASDFISVCVRSADRGISGVVESGGELLEMGELAERIAARVNPRAGIVRSPMTSSDPLVYASDNRSWQEAVRTLATNEMPIDRQIDATAEWLRSRARI